MSDRHSHSRWNDNLDRQISVLLRDYADKPEVAIIVEILQELHTLVSKTGGSLDVVAAALKQLTEVVQANVEAQREQVAWGRQHERDEFKFHDQLRQEIARDRDEFQKALAKHSEALATIVANASGSKEAGEKRAALWRWFLGLALTAAGVTATWHYEDFVQLRDLAHNNQLTLHRLAERVGLDGD